jgi:ADP-heptose:LPS heptosyltransferase
MILDRRDVDLASARPLPGRWYVMRLVDWLVRLWPTPATRRGALVVIADSGLGDVTLAHFAIAQYPALLGMPPGAITIVGTSPAASLAPLIFPGMVFKPIDEIAFHRNPLYRFRFARWIRREGFAVAICGSFMRKPMVCDALIELSGAPRQIAVSPYRTPKTARMFAAYDRPPRETIEAGDYPTAEIRRASRVASAVARRPIELVPPRIAWSGARPAGLPTRYAVIAAGASVLEKCWPLENFMAVARSLAAHGLTPVFIGGDTDHAPKQALQSAECNSGFIDRIGATTLPGLFDLLAHAALFVGNDTGPAHIATALGTPTVVVLGGGHFGANFPYPPEATPASMRVLFREMPCFHCEWHCTQPHEAGRPVPCIDAIGVDEVERAAEACLAAAGAP